MQQTFYKTILTAGIWFAIASAVTAEPMTHNQTPQFRRLEQPLAVKLAVTGGGLALIGLELWWFLASKTKARSATFNQGIQEIDITVDGGYSPDQILAQAGQKVRLNFYRKDPSSCLETVIFPDFQIARDLELNQVTPIELTAPKPGEYAFTCGMNMFRGILKVQPPTVEQDG